MWRDYIKQKKVILFLGVALFCIALGGFFLVNHFLSEIRSDDPYIRSANPVADAATSGAPGATPPTAANQTLQPVPDANTPKEGEQYLKLPGDIALSLEVQQWLIEHPGKTQVIEFFNYACYWCSRLNPVLTEWEKTLPPNVVYERIPVIFQPSWEPLARTFYALKVLDKNDELDIKLFNAIHNDRKNLSDETSLKLFMSENGVDPDKFMEAYNSFGVERDLKQAIAVRDLYKITLSPTFVINTPNNGSYSTNATLTGSEAGVINVLNYLLGIKPTLPSKKDNP